MAKKAIRPIRIEGKIAYVPLTKGYEAMIDAADVPLVCGRNWHARVEEHTVYAMAKMKVGLGPAKKLFLHKVITGYALTDHCDGNGLNNSRENLREATPAENSRNCRRRASNTSGFKGVSWSKRDKRWYARIRHEGRIRHLGCYDTPEDAHAAYCDASKRFHGEFGRTA